MGGRREQIWPWTISDRLAQLCSQMGKLRPRPEIGPRSHREPWWEPGLTPTPSLAHKRGRHSELSKDFSRNDSDGEHAHSAAVLFYSFIYLLETVGWGETERETNVIV